MSLVAPVFMPVTAAAFAYVAWRVRWGAVAERFFTGKGRNSRILLLVFVVLNWKNMPFAWTVSSNLQAPTLFGSGDERC